MRTHQGVPPGARTSLPDRITGPFGSLRFWTALLIAKLAVRVVTRLHPDGATSLPGLIAERIDPAIVRRVSARLPHGVILVTGSNGKTTTAALLAETLRAEGLRVVHNDAGANLSRGVASALLQAVPAKGGPAARPGGPQVGVLEVDEAAMPAIAAATAPRAIVVTNLFRDQLDRFGEVDTALHLLRRAVEAAPSATLVLNADDPLVWLLAARRERVVGFGLAGGASGGPDLTSLDVVDCPRCGGPLEFSWRSYGHLGAYACLRCGYRRPTPDFTARSLGTEGAATSLRVGRRGRDVPFVLPLPGLHNVYNLLAVAGASSVMGISLDRVFEPVARFAGVFGRSEHAVIHGRRLVMHLVKNPVGLSQTVRTVAETRGDFPVLIGLNDHAADGRDVSWIWDAALRELRRGARQVVATGIRAADVALRLKYLDFPMDRVLVEPDVDAALDRALALTARSEELVALVTYTAMLQLRRALKRRRAGAGTSDPDRAEGPLGPGQTAPEAAATDRSTSIEVRRRDVA